MNSFIAWSGGKRLLRKEIVRRFPQEGFQRYIEVFGGAGWVLFEKVPGKELEVFNDIDRNLINLYRCIKYHCGELQRELRYLLISREEFFSSKDQLAAGGLTDIQRASRYFYLVKASFGADRKTFGTTRRNLRNAVDYFMAIQDRLQNVVIENRDFEALIHVYDRDGALFYLDPPYHGTEGYYEGGFNEKDHERLLKTLSGIKGKFILSYNNDAYVRDLYKGFRIEDISRMSNLTSKGSVRNFEELIIRNY